MSFSRSQKLNARSSTEVELIGLDDTIPGILWGRYFLEAQGYDVTQNIVYQDNKSTILLATNGRSSSLRNTKHIRDRAKLMNCPVEYDDQDKAKLTHPDLIPGEESDKIFLHSRGNNSPNDKINTQTAQARTAQVSQGKTVEGLAPVKRS